MSIDFCALCNDPCTGANASIGNNNMQETWRTLVAQTLCGLVSNDPNIAEAIQLPQDVKTAAEITAGYTAYADPGFLDAEKKLRYFTATNTTDADIEISLDNGTSTNFRVFAGTSRDFDLGNHVFAAQDDFQIRRASGMTATLGSFYLDGRY